MPIAQTASSAAARELSGFAAIIGLCMMFAAGKAILHDTMDPDFFWHVRVADQLHHDGVHALVDQISFASIKTPWTPYSWLGELGMKWIWYHTGLRGAIMVQAGLESLFILLIVLCCFEKTNQAASRTTPKPLLPIVIATAAATFLAMPYLSFRPVLAAIDLLAFCALLLLRDRRLGERTRAIWALPIIAAITINLHLFAIFVPLWVGALMVGAAIERDKPKRKRYGILLLACIVACICTPMAGGTFSVIREYISDNPLTAHSMISELEPMYHGLGGQITLGLVSIVILLAAFQRTMRAGEWLWLGGMFLLWIKCGRAAPLFVLIFAPMMCEAMPRLRDRALGSKWINYGALAVLLIGGMRIAFSLPDNRNPDAWFNRRGPELPGYPTVAAEFVDANIQPTTGRLINEFDWGGYIAWKLPGRQILLDGRTQLYTPEFWQSAYLSDRPQTTQFLSAIDADAAILPAGKSRFRESLQQLDWKRVHSDPRAEVWTPPAAVATDGG